MYEIVAFHTRTYTGKRYCMILIHDIASIGISVIVQVTSKEDELASKDQELSRALREAAEINESYINDLTAGQQQLEADVAALTAQHADKDAQIAELEERAQQRQGQEQEMQQAQKRLRGQVCLNCLYDAHAD